jgi:hypothetical protein
MQLTRKNLSDIYKPNGPKKITSVAWSSGGSQTINTGIDLSLPIRGFRLVFSGRLVIGTAAFTSVNPEGLLNLISNIHIDGQNARQGGNLTLWDIDLATLWVCQHLFGQRSGYFSIDSGSGEVLKAVPTTPFPAAGASGYINGATGTYDFRIIVDMPAHLFASNKFGNHAEMIAAFAIRQEEWKDTITIKMNFGAQAGNSTGALGVAAATTTVTFTAYGSGAGSPTIDLYVLPISLGPQLKDAVLPGVISRTSQQISAVLQAAANNTALVHLQKQPTTRIIAKFGTGTVPPAMATLSDTNVTALGVQLGGNRNVRNVVDVFAHKQSQQDTYDRDAIQGYLVMDFTESGNPDSAYPGQEVGEGSTFDLVANVTGVANAQGVILQEQVLHQHTGALYNG